MYEHPSYIHCSVAGFFLEKFKWCLIEHVSQLSKVKKRFKVLDLKDNR